MRVSIFLLLPYFGLTACACGAEPRPAASTPSGSSQIGATAGAAGAAFGTQTNSADESTSQVTAPETPASAAVAPGSAVPSSKPTNELTIRMLNVLARKQHNLVFSAVSLRDALGVATLGARGTTFDELVHALFLAQSYAEIVTSAKRDATEWRLAAGKAELVRANRLWVDKTVKLKQTYLDQTQAGYSAFATSVDFAYAPEASRKTINGWVSGETRGRIKSILPPLDPLTRMVITNAVYFSGKWAKAFDVKRTAKGPFFTDAGPIDAPFMHAEMGIDCFGNAEVEVGILPYRASDLAMVIVLPQKQLPLSALEAKLTAKQLDEWVRAAHSTKAEVVLPKFNFSWGGSVRAELEALGVRTAFTIGADFSAMAPATEAGLSVTDVIHRATIVVNEVGTKAAAATAIIMKTPSAVDITEFKVDRPFLFFIRSQKSGETLFAGRVVNPEESSQAI